jgi:hypothetical protein
VTRKPRRPAGRRSVWLTFGPPLIVSLVVVVLGGGYWYAKIHQRADAASVARDVGANYPGAHITCAKLSSNAATWACAVVYHAESECAAAKVSVTGSISSKQGHDRCTAVPQLSSAVPKPTSASVAADITRLGFSHSTPLVCVPVPGTKTRWACEPRHQSSGQCSVVRVVPWVPWKVHTGSGVCAQIPALRRAAA